MVADRKAGPPDNKQIPSKTPEGRKRRESEKDILWAFNFACEIGEIGVAERLLNVLEKLLADRTGLSVRTLAREQQAVLTAVSRLRSIKKQ